MEGFLSLPRSAKAGLAVLLAVALLGWGIVAYSSKRQHENARNLQQALATLDGKTDAEQNALAELSGIRDQLTAAETDLFATLKDKTALENQISQLETDLGAREKAVSDLTERLDALDSAGADADGPEQALGLAGEQGSNIDVAMLRERLTKARTALSARSATLEQRNRELERARADNEAATARVAMLEADLVGQGVLRERLDTTKTMLSARTATLAQRDRELERTRADYQAATTRMAALEADLVEQGTLRERLSKTMTMLSGRTATLAQRDRAFANLSEEHETALSKLAAFEAETSEKKEADQTLSSLQSRVDRTEQALAKGAEALALNQAKIEESEIRLIDLQADLKTIEEGIAEKEQQVAERARDLLGLEGKVAAEQKRLAGLVATLEERQADIEEAEGQLADLEKAQAEAEASISSLTAELDQQESALGSKEDAVAFSATRLAALKDEIAMTEQRVAEKETMLGKKVIELRDRQQDVKAVEATLSALKEERAVKATETVELRNAIIDQESVLRDLEAAKSDLEKTKVELGYQEKILNERQEQIAIADDRLDQLHQAVKDGSKLDQTFAGIPIAALSTDNLAVLPIDPMYEPFPIQTPIGIRLTQVHFDMGSAQLTPGGLRRAKEAAEWIKAQDVEKIRLVGFTDSIGTKANNLTLAKRRADALLGVFEEQGVDPNRIEIIAKGEVGAREVTEDQTAEPLNRCVGVFIGADG